LVLSRVRLIRVKLVLVNLNPINDTYINFILKARLAEPFFVSGLVQNLGIWAFYHTSQRSKSQFRRFETKRPLSHPQSHHPKKGDRKCSSNQSSNSKVSLPPCAAVEPRMEPVHELKGCHDAMLPRRLSTGVAIRRRVCLERPRPGWRDCHALCSRDAAVDCASLESVRD